MVERLSVEEFLALRIVAALAGATAVGIAVATLFGGLNASLGVWTLVVLLFLGGVQLVSVGILGRYLARVHEQTLGRPLYVVDRVAGSSGASAGAAFRHRRTS